MFLVSCLHKSFGPLGSYLVWGLRFFGALGSYNFWAWGSFFLVSCVYIFWVSQAHKSVGRLGSYFFGPVYICLYIYICLSFMTLLVSCDCVQRHRGLFY